MKVVYPERHAYHRPRHFLAAGAHRPNPEAPERADRLRAATKADGHTVIAADAHGPGPAAAVHTPAYLHFLRTIVGRWRQIEGASEEVIPKTHPQGRWGAGYPESPVGQAGYHQADTACPIAEGTWEAVVNSAEAAVTGAELVAAGEPVAYALCRPPGHHAFPDMAGGFCFLNNTAIAVERLRRHAGRVAVLDVDVHHGNGTQSVFDQRPDVFTVSLHADPAHYFPFYWGYAQERGTGPGTGYNLNLPLPLGTRIDAYMAALDHALAQIRAFDPDVLVVALGLDAHVDDPLQGMALTTAELGRVTEAIAALRLPTLLVQEGGYLQPALEANLQAALRGFAALDRG
ncbi:Acetoin utilization deacetylase AcuC [Limimonas halophila]|uniref:Acetoin utilization deacetylase AcuC n=1 Tax=Limimonas halophila TaxID=1082479 RepID=A0A1G7PWM1_9PROT|nr:histone deacetylase family protein [Limimonas halophila]SDF90638.1 Acetoin utilization deacetylase AcuC [Limimonas halophila]